jgi:hypothetical protein
VYQKYDENTTNHLSEWVKSKTLKTTLNARVELKELSFVASGNTKWYSHFKDYLAVCISYETKHTPTMIEQQCSLVFNQLT